MQIVISWLRGDIRDSYNNLLRFSADNKYRECSVACCNKRILDRPLRNAKHRVASQITFTLTLKNFILLFKTWWCIDIYDNYAKKVSCYCVFIVIFRDGCRANVVYNLSLLESSLIYYFIQRDRKYSQKSKLRTAENLIFANFNHFKYHGVRLELDYFH